MSRKTLYFRGTVALAIGSALGQTPVAAVQPRTAAVSEARAIRDISLSSGGVLKGQLVDPAGAIQTGVKVSLLRHGQEVATCSTDGQGAFELAGLSGGTYQLVADGMHQDVRLWAAGTAPPAAVPSALVVTKDSLTRGQLPAAVAGLAGSASTAGAIAVGGIIGVGAYAVTQADSGS
jgi:hypothetical protein